MVKYEHWKFFLNEMPNIFWKGNDELAALIEPALDLNRDIQTNFNVANWNGGTVNTGLTIQNAYFISNITCSGTQCSAVRLV